ncbi:MAG: tRNA (adenosine(37)-N6)-threonylcarbamoyltransferase complex dimerization subunit type 1 TsaB [Ignavibacteria bacterium]|nr:tRNA (adenosine(37)-N6)-threonylcarbamoyltransferase complex dimerization subunit type 1 TsaB [Ignavibacteria bacterium]
MILAIETSQSACGAAVFENADKYAESILRKERSHASMITSVIQAAMIPYKASVQDIKAIAVSAGPGSFTGLRIGLSTAKGMCYGSQISLIMVPTFEAIALEIVSTCNYINNFVVMFKANTTEFFCAKFSRADDGYAQVTETKPISMEEIEDMLQEEDFLVSDKNWLNVKKYVNLSAPKPRFIASWAAQYGKEIPYTEIDLVEPLYLKDFIIKRKEVKK